MPVAPLYLFTGPEAGERNDAILELRVQARKRVGMLDEYTFYAAETRVSDIMSLLLNESLFAAARFIVVKGAEQIKRKEDIALIESWVNSAGINTCSSILILVSEDISCDKKLELLVPKPNKRIFWELFESRKEQWLFNFFKKNGYSLAQDAAAVILELVENNTEALRSECSRFFLCFDKGHLITADEADKMLAHNREESAFTLFDALCDMTKAPRYRLESGLEIFQKLRLSKDSSSAQLIAGLTYCFRRLNVWHRLYLENPAPSDSDLKNHGFASKKSQSLYRAASRIWDSLAVGRILAVLADSDIEIRTSGTAGEESVICMLLYTIVIKNGMPVAAYEMSSW